MSWKLWCLEMAECGAGERAEVKEKGSRGLHRRTEASWVKCVTLSNLR